MKKLTLLFCLVLLLGPAFALEYRPNTVRETDLAVVIRATGNYSGEITRGDSLEIKFLTLKGDRRQTILSIEEKMVIAGDEIAASHVEENGNRYAVFKIDDLKKYGDNAEFEIVIDAGLNISAEMGIDRDYLLSTPITEEEKYLMETHYIEVNDAVLREKAGEFESDSLIESMRETAEWVHANLEYDLDNYYQGTWSARQTYDSRKGVCDEFANLTAAFTRINGIPTRYVSGISFDGKKFGNHGWLEAYMPGTGWVGLDSTYSEVGYVDALHITLAKSSDANENVNLLATTWSVNPIAIETTLHEPEVNIRDIVFFNKLLNIEIVLPERVESGEEFEVRAIIWNVMNSNIVIPIRLSLHEDFGFENGKKIVWLKPLEQIEMAWTVNAPEYTDEETYAIYGMKLLTPDNEIEAKVNVHAKKGNGNGGNGNGTEPPEPEKNWLLELEKFAEMNTDAIIIIAIVLGVLVIAAQFLIKR